MKKLKIVSVALALILSFSLFGTLVACNKEEEPAPVVKERYDFVFDVNYDGGTGRKDTVKAGYKANYYAARRNGYTLVNWYVDKNCTEPFDFSTPINKDYTVYALWEKRGADVDVTFNYNYKNCQSPMVVTGEEGKVLDKKLVPDPNRLGYEVEGWYTDAACTKKWNMDTDKVQGNLNLYAKYNCMANLKFDTNGEVILKNVEVNIACQMLSWTGRRSLNEIVDNFNDEYSGKVYLNWTESYTNEVARFEDPGFTNQYAQNNYRIGELLDLVNMEFDKNEYYEPAIRENFVGNTLVTYPVGHLMPSVMYNKAMLQELGEEEPKTHQDFVRVLEKAEAAFKNREGYKYTLVYENEWQWFEMGSNQVWASNGFSAYSYDSGKGKFVNNLTTTDGQGKFENAVKGYANILNNAKISTTNTALWENQEPFFDVVNGNAFMGIVSYPKMYSYLAAGSVNLWKKVGIMPISEMFNYANIQDSQIFVKGISLCLPSDTDALFDAEQLAGIAVFCKYLEKHSELLAYNFTYPASKTGQKSDALKEGSSTPFYVLQRIVGDPSKFVTLPGSSFEYACYNYINQSMITALSSVDAASIGDQSLIKSVMGLVNEIVAPIIVG